MYLDYNYFQIICRVIMTLHNLTTFIAIKIFLFVSDIPEVQCAIKCYKCFVAPPTHYTNESSSLCKDFDYSDKFIVNCPYSTFCIKTISSAKIPGNIHFILVNK